MLELIGLCVLFLAFHFSIKWHDARSEAKIAGKPAPGLFAFLADNPAYVLMTVLGTSAAFWLFASMDWLNPGAAAALGIAGASMAKNTAKQYENVQALK